MSWADILIIFGFVLIVVGICGQWLFRYIKAFLENQKAELEQDSQTRTTTNYDNNDG